MPVICLPSLMKYYTDNMAEVPVSGGTVTLALEELTSRYPAIRTHIMDSQGRLRRHVNLFVNKENIKTLDGMNTKVKEADRIVLMSSISGG
jgi:sulfur-carrier protein